MKYIGLDLAMTSSAIVEVDESGEYVRTFQPRLTRKPAWVGFHDFVAEFVAMTTRIGEPLLAAIETPLLRGNGALERAGLWGNAVRILQHRFVMVAPVQLKMFAGASARAAKDEVRLKVYKRWGFEDPSNDVVDAFVLAQMARAYWLLRAGQTDGMGQWQIEVLMRVAKGMTRCGA